MHSKVVKISYYIHATNNYEHIVNKFENTISNYKHTNALHSKLITAVVST